MSQDILRRIKSLIELTSSAAVEEARNAALIACKLIIQHGLVVVAPEDLSAAATKRVKGEKKPKGQGPVIVNGEVTDIVSNAAGRVVSSVLRDMLGGRR